MDCYNAIWFDLDGTLWDFNRNSEEVLKELYQLHLASYSFTDTHFVKTYREVNLEMWKGLRERSLTKEDVRRLRFQLTLKRLGIVDDNLAQEFNVHYMLETPNRGHLIDGVEEVLKWLKSLNKRLVICSNGFKESQIKKLKSTIIGDYIDALYCADELGVHKPHEDFFRTVLRLEEVKECEVVYVGDDVRVDGACVNVGIDFIHYQSGNIFHQMKG